MLGEKKYAVYCTGVQPDMGICQLTSTFEDNVSSWQIFGIANPRLVAYRNGSIVFTRDFKADTVQDLKRATDDMIEALQSFECEIGSAVYLVDPLRPRYAHMAFVRIE